MARRENLELTSPLIDITGISPCPHILVKKIKSMLAERSCPYYGGMSGYRFECYEMCPSIDLTKYHSAHNFLTRCFQALGTPFRPFLQLDNLPSNWRDYQISSQKYLARLRELLCCGIISTTQRGNDSRMIDELCTEIASLTNESKYFYKVEDLFKNQDWDFDEGLVTLSPDRFTFFWVLEHD